MVAAPASNNQPPVRPPALLEATQRSTAAWQNDLQSLFHRAKDRFPDVVWELNDGFRVDGPTEPDSCSEEVYGHKAIVYARAPPSFQARYFSFRPAPVSTPVPYDASSTPSLPMLATSALSLNLAIDAPYSQSLRSVSPSQFRSNSPVPSILGSLSRISLSEKTALFSDELEYLYTGKGFGEAFDFLFESTTDDKPSRTNSGTNTEETRLDKLRKDLVFMWRSRLYSDVKIELTGSSAASSPTSEEEAVPVFWSHRFILVSRSPYFYDQLITYGLKNLPALGEPAKVRLDSPPFTPPALHFTLGYLYSGTLNFSNRTYDLDTAFAILLSANYLQLQALYDEVQARLMQEMLHGLFHAFLEFTEYERITGGRWGTGGCRCRQCARRAPRVLLFAVRPEVQNVYLERGARRALVGLFGEGWCTSEFSILPQKTKDGLMKGLTKRTTPLNVFPLLFASHSALKRLGSIRDAWADGVRDMVNAARTTIDAVLCNEAEKCFNEPDWVEILENDGLGRFEDGERVEWTMDAIKRGITECNAGTLYQALVSAILLRPHPTEANDTLLSSTSQIRVQVEQTRMDIIRWLRKRWVGVRQENGFDQLESWAVKEIAHEIDVAYEDLIGSNGPPTRGAPTRTGLRPTLSRVEDVSERDSTYSMRPSILNKNVGRTNTVGGGGSSAQPVLSSGASIRSMSRSIVSHTTHTSRASRLTTGTTATERARKESRPDSKFSPNNMRSVSPVPLLPSTSTPASPLRVTASDPQTSSYMDVDGGSGEVEETDADELGATTALTTQAASTASSRRSGPSARMLRAQPAKESDSASIRSMHETMVVTIQRPKSVAPSVSSVRTQREREPSSTAKRSGTGSGTPSARGTTPSESRPASTVPTLTVTTRSESRVGTRSSVKDKENGGNTSRGRKVSATSTISASGRNTVSRSPRRSAPSLPNSASGNKSGGSTGSTRPRRLSDASGLSTTRQSASRTRKLSATSTTAAANERPVTLIVRRSPSSNSVKSGVSSASVSPTPPAAGRRSGRSSPTEEKKSGQAVSMKKSLSGSSAASNHNKPLPRKPSSTSMSSRSESRGGSPTAAKGKEREKNDTAVTLRPHSRISQCDTGSTTTRSTVRRRESTETIRLSKNARASSKKPDTTDHKPPAPKIETSESTAKQPPEPVDQKPRLPRGATLDIGIPCIVHSKRKKFRAYARYIGEVEGERGPWVGIEVPIVNDAWWGTGDRAYQNGDPAMQQDEDGRQWHDGTWCGIRYFELGGCSSGEPDNSYNDFYDERERSLRRRVAAMGGGSLGFGGPWYGGGHGFGSFGARNRTLKRGGDDQLGLDTRQKRFRSASPSASDISGAEYRGLFVRPQQVLYVVDAVGAD